MPFARRRALACSALVLLPLACAETPTEMGLPDAAPAIDAAARVHALEIFFAGDGAGRVVAESSGINCEQECTTMLEEGTAVALVAVPSEGSSFRGWSGACSSIGDCAIALESSERVTATFTRDLGYFVVALSGDGQGTVAIDPPGTVCSDRCIERPIVGTEMQLTARPDMNSKFVTWSIEQCEASATCTFTAGENNEVTAFFEPVTHVLTASVTGRGSGVVTSDVGDINCSSNGDASRCWDSFVTGTPVTLDPIADVGSFFSGWSGCPTDALGACTIVVDMPMRLGARFELEKFPLTITTGGDGIGSIQLSPASAEYEYGTPVKLEAVPRFGSSFAAWTGDCATAMGSSCDILIDGPKNVGAIFDRVMVDLAVTIDGTGTGTVTSTPPGISCPPSCSASFPQTSTLALSAQPSTGSTFWRWRGDCSGNADCPLTMDADRSVSAELGGDCDRASVELDGSSGNLFLPYAPSIETGSQLLVELWFSATAPRTDDVLVSRHDPSNNACSYKLAFNGTSGLSWCVYSACSAASTDAVCRTVTTGIGAGRWTHVAATFETGGSPRLFIDGVERTGLLANLGAGANAAAASSADFVIGRTTDTAGRDIGFVSAMIASLRVRAATLTTGISFIPNPTFDPTPDTVIFWPVEEKAGTTVFDYSELGTHDGSLVGRASWVSSSPRCRISVEPVPL